MSEKMCSICNKRINRLDNLKRHERICKLKSGQQQKSPIKYDLLDEILNGKHRSQPPTEEIDEVIKVSLPDLEVPKPKVKKLAINSTPTQHFLPSSEEDLKEKLRLLYAENIAGNTTTKPQIFKILRELCSRGVISKAECKSVGRTIENMESKESSETSSKSESMDENSAGSETDESNELDFYQLVNATVENLTRSTRRNLYKTLQVWNKDISKMIDDYINGEDKFKDILTKLAKSKDVMKVKMLLKSMRETKNRITNVLETLRNTEEKDVGQVLEHLKLHNKISEQEFQRLLSSANDIVSHAKAIQGCGLWI